MDMQEDEPWRDSADLRWLFLDLNSYFASVEQQERPALRGKPVIVVPVESVHTSAIAASYEAKAFGIKTNMKVREALERCPDLRVVQARHDLYVDYHHRIVDVIEDHLHVSKVCSIDEVACELLGPERLTANAMRIARAIQQAILDRIGPHLRSSVGLAPSRLLAKIASDMKKPMGLTVLGRQSLPGPLLDLDLIDLPGIGSNMERRLRRAGINSIAALWSLTPRQARDVWGSVEGERFSLGLHGNDPVELETVRRSVGHSHVLPQPLRDPVAARLVARRLLLMAAMRMRRMEHSAKAMSVGIRLQSGERLHAQRRFQPCADSFALLRHFESAWAEMWPQVAGLRLKKVGVTLDGLIADGSILPDLFTQGEAVLGQPGRGLRLSRTLDRLNRRFGRDTVSVGMTSKPLSRYVGAKIAFNRIPDRRDFLE